MLIRLLCLCIGYLFGLFQTAYLYGRLKGIDIREHGSGNAGTTNALRTLGKKAGAITFLGDCFKCILGVLVIHLLFADTHTNSIKLLELYGAAGVILGHNYPFYLNFKGGKGIAATAELLCAVYFPMALVACLVFVAALSLTHYVSVGSLAVYIVFVFLSLLFGSMGVFHLEGNNLLEFYLLVFLLALLAFWKHKDNIKRLLHGNENKTYLLKKNKETKK